MAALDAGEVLDDDVLSRATITHVRRGKRWMEKQGGAISLWPGWGATEVPMEDQPDGEYGAWAARQLDEAALLGEPVLDRVSAKVSEGFVGVDEERGEVYGHAASIPSR
jgi:hypothetical protein